MVDMHLLEMVWEPWMVLIITILIMVGEEVGTVGIF